YLVPYTTLFRSLYSLCVVSASTLSSGKRSLTSLQKSTPLISGKPTSSRSTSGFQKPMELRHSAALCAIPVTSAIPDSSIRLLSRSVRILWSSTMATLIMLFVVYQLQFHMNFGSLSRREYIHLTLTCIDPLLDVPVPPPLGSGLQF